MKLVPIAKTIACSTGAVLIYAGLYTFSAEKLLDYFKVEDEEARGFVLGLSALSTLSFISITRVGSLWERFSKKQPSLPASNNGWLMTFLKGLIVANAFTITVLFSFLSAKSLLNLVGVYSPGVIIAAGLYVSFSAYASYLAFLYAKIAGPNIELIGEFFTGLRGDNNRFNRGAALSALALSLFAIISYTFFMNFAIKGALASFPGAKGHITTATREGVAFFLAITNIPTLVLNYLMQAYRFFDPNEKSLELKTKYTCLTSFSYFLLAVAGLVFLFILAGGAYISIIDVIAQIKLDTSVEVTQTLAIASAVSVLFSDYVLTYRAVEAYVIRWLNAHYHPQDSSAYTSLLTEDDYQQGGTVTLEEFEALASNELRVNQSSASSTSNWASLYAAAKQAAVTSPNPHYSV